MSSSSYPMSSVYLMLVIPHVSQFIGYPFLFVIHNIPAFVLDILRYVTSNVLVSGGLTQRMFKML